MQQTCDCIKTTVSFRGLCEERKDCHHYIDEVFGVTPEMPELLIDDLRPTGAKVIESVLSTAASDFVEFVRGEVGEKFVEQSIFRDEYSGIWQTPHVPIPAEAGRLRGKFISLADSPYLNINISSVELYTANNGLAEEKIRIIDLDRGTTIEEFTFDASATAGQFVSVDISRTYFGYRRIFVAYRSELSSLKITAYDRSHYARICKPCACGTWSQCATSSATGVITYDTLDLGQDCGLRVCYGIGCSIDGWICNNKSRFAEAFKHSAALHLFEEVMGSDKLNRVTNIDPDKLQAMYNKASIRMARSVTNIVKGASFSCKYCFPCNPNRTRKFYSKP